MKHPGLLVQKSQQISFPSAAECQILAISEKKAFEEDGVSYAPHMLGLGSTPKASSSRRVTMYQCNCKHFANYLASFAEGESFLMRPSQLLAESLLFSPSPNGTQEVFGVLPLSEFWGQGYWTPPPLNRYFCLLMGTAKHRDFRVGAVVLCIIAGTNKDFGKLNVGKLLFVRQQDRISPALLFRLSVLCDCFCFLYQMFLPKGIDVLKI